MTVTTYQRIYEAPDPVGSYSDHYLLADIVDNTSAVKIPVTKLFADASAVGIGTATPGAGLDIDVAALPLHVKLAGTTKLKINDKGMAIGDHTPAGDDDFLHIKRNANNNLSMIIDNQNAGSGAQTVIHMWSENAGLRLASYSDAAGGFVNIIAHDVTEFNLMNSANTKMNFWTNNVRRLFIAGNGQMTLGGDTTVDGLRDFTISNTNSDGTGAQAQLSVITAGPTLRLTAYNTGSYGNLYATNCTQGFNILLASNAPLKFYTNNLARMTVLGSGDVGLGNTNPSSLLHLTKSSGNTASIQPLLILGVNSTGTPANGFGSRIEWKLETDTTDNITAALLDVTWVAAAHGSQKGRLQLWAYDTTGRECIRMEASGTEPMLGFYGVNSTTRQVLATGAGATVDDIITKLQTLGLVKQS